LAVALPSERTEAILAGMVEGFAFFGCVAWEVWIDYVSGHIIPLMCPIALCGRQPSAGQSDGLNMEKQVT
jgi:hypothetical protein